MADQSCNSLSLSAFLEQVRDAEAKGMQVSMHLGPLSDERLSELSTEMCSITCFWIDWIDADGNPQRELICGRFCGPV